MICFNIAYITLKWLWMVFFVALGHPHTFFCRLELGSDWEVPPKFECLVEVEFDMPSASASKATVRSLSVGDRTDLKKWITYKSHYSYQVLCVCLCVRGRWRKLCHLLLKLSSRQGAMRSN